MKVYMEGIRNLICILAYNVSNFNQIQAFLFIIIVLFTILPLDRYSVPLCALFRTPSHSHPRTVSYKFTFSRLALKLSCLFTSPCNWYVNPPPPANQIHLPRSLSFSLSATPFSNCDLRDKRESSAWVSLLLQFCFLFLYFTLLLLLRLLNQLPGMRVAVALLLLLLFFFSCV